MPKPLAFRRRATAARCPTCHDGVAASRAATCRRCGAEHHRERWAAHGACASCDELGVGEPTSGPVDAALCALAEQAPLLLTAAGVGLVLYALTGDVRGVLRTRGVVLFIVFLAVYFRPWEANPKRGVLCSRSCTSSSCSRSSTSACGRTELRNAKGHPERGGPAK